MNTIYTPKIKGINHYHRNILDTKIIHYSTLVYAIHVLHVQNSFFTMVYDFLPSGQYLPIEQSVASGSWVSPAKQYRPGGHFFVLTIASSEVDELSQ